MCPRTALFLLWSALPRSVLLAFVHLLAAVTLSFPNQGASCTKAMSLLIFGQFVLSSFVTNKMLKTTLACVTELDKLQRVGEHLVWGPAI